MKCFVALLFLLSYMSVGQSQSCGRSICPPCPEGTYRYSVGCDYIQPEATCKNPKPKKNKEGAQICDYTACYCKPPTVRDEESKKCVELAHCPGSSTPTDPVNPTVPVTPIDPVTPNDPVTPIDPVTPRDPVTPVNPVTPVGPVTPQEPVFPNAPDPDTPSICD